jgi:hypothetical protein
MICIEAGSTITLQPPRCRISIPDICPGCADVASVDATATAINGAAAEERKRFFHS